MSSRSGRLWGGRPALAAAVVLALAAALTAAVVLRDDDGRVRAGTRTTPSALPSVTPSPAPPDTVADPKYYADVRVALSPLVVHVRDIPRALGALALPGSERFSSLATLAASWESDVATARDLVTRLPAPGGTQNDAVKRLYQAGSLLYVEAAKSISSAAQRPSAQRVPIARAGLRYLQIGDRAFDSAYRLLNADADLSDIEMIFPVTVPDFTVAKPVAVYDLEPATAAVGAWSRTRKDLLARVRDAVASPDDANEVSVTDLRAAVKSLGSPVPADVVSREGVITARLGALTVAESLSRKDAAGAERLALIGQQLWSVGDALLAETGETRVSGVSLFVATSAQAAPDVLYAGGVFNGTPPPLKPGEDPGVGVPGGLPALDPLAILGGR